MICLTDMATVAVQRGLLRSDYGCRLLVAESVKRLRAVEVAETRASEVHIHGLTRGVHRAGVLASD